MRIKEAREKSKISQKNLGELLDVKQSAVSQWETGATSPLAEKLPTIAAVLGCRIEELYDEEELIQALSMKYSNGAMGH
ncbi:MAG: helix-turn-helix domain-containing protein [Eubacteriaceae bacterium]